jgi:hypothetical protein
MQEHNLWWLAGLFEGEGWFGLHKQRSNYTGKEIVNPAVSIKMVDRDIIERVHVIMGHGSLASVVIPSGKTAYIYRTSGKNAVEFMKRLQPLMGDRRAHKIGEVLEAWRIKNENRTSSLDKDKVGKVEDSGHEFAAD